MVVSEGMELVIVLLVILARREPGLDVRGIVSVAIRSLIAAAIAGGVVIWALVVIGDVETEPAKVGVLIQATLATIAGGVAYLAVAFALRIPELGSIVAIVADLARRRARS